MCNGSQLTQETVTTETTTDDGTVSTTDVLYYSYDASGNPMAVEYTDNSGTKTTYYYVVNIQGDVAAILNTSGTAVVTYTYDAWGNPLSTVGTQADTLGAQNSLRGHNVKNGTMFSSLTKYKSQSYYDEHPVLFPFTSEAEYKIELIAGFVSKPTWKMYNAEQTYGQILQYYSLSTLHADAIDQQAERMLSLPNFLRNPLTNIYVLHII